MIKVRFRTVNKTESDEVWRGEMEIDSLQFLLSGNKGSDWFRVSVGGSWKYFNQAHILWIKEAS